MVLLSASAKQKKWPGTEGREFKEKVKNKQAPNQLFEITKFLQRKRGGVRKT